MRLFTANHANLPCRWNFAVADSKSQTCPPKR
jgi:hypothetical protein